MVKENNVIRERSYAFALRVVRISRELTRQNEYVLSRQLLRSGTSIGANVEEALGGQSRKDFIAKMAIAYKEARETNYWLRLIRDSGVAGKIDISTEIDESDQLVRILASIIKKLKENNNS